MTRASHKDWLLWQLADSSLPTGGFAHSSGLEAAWQHGEIRNGAELGRYIEASLDQSGHGSLPMMLAAFDEADRLGEVDHLCESFTTNHVANRASRLQGRALLSSAQRIFALSMEEMPFGHWAPAFGAVAFALEIEREPAARLFCFMHLRGLIAAAVRLGIIGPLEAQSIQHHLGPVAEEIVGGCLAISIEDISQTAPLLELWQGTQDRLYSRLFQS